MIPSILRHSRAHRIKIKEMAKQNETRRFSVIRLKVTSVVTLEFENLNALIDRLRTIFSIVDEASHRIPLVGSSSDKHLYLTVKDYIPAELPHGVFLIDVRPVRGGR